MAALQEEGKHEDETRILGDISRKALRQMEEYVTALLGRKLYPQPRGRSSQVEYAPGRERGGRRRFP